MPWSITLRSPSRASRTCLGMHLLSMAESAPLLITMTFPVSEFCTTLVIIFLAEVKSKNFIALYSSIYPLTLMVKTAELRSMNSTRPVLAAISSRQSSSWLGPVKKLFPSLLVTLVTSWQIQMTLKKSSSDESFLSSPRRDM